MTKIIAYLPTYSPETDAIPPTRAYTRQTQEQILSRMNTKEGFTKPTLYMDCIDSVLNIRPDIKLVVADGRSTDSIRAELQKHQYASCEMPYQGYGLKLYPEKMSQWVIFNDIFKEHQDADYYVYTSSDIVWTMDWISEAIKEFDKAPRLQIIFPCVNRGDPNLPCQIAPNARDLPLIAPPYQDAARAPVLNGYAMIFRMSFLRTYGGYPTAYSNCFTESFLPYMCEAMGGYMRLMPRGWVFHWGEGDKWVGVGGAYNYTTEKPKFDNMMNNLQMVRAMKRMTPEFLKHVLYKKEIT